MAASENDEEAARQQIMREHEAWVAAAARNVRPEIDTWAEDFSDWDEFKDVLRSAMSTDEAKEIRRIRCDEGFTWRAVAGYCHEKFSAKWSIGWELPNWQAIGTLICDVAAHKLDERPEHDPWN